MELVGLSLKLRPPEILDRGNLLDLILDEFELDSVLLVVEDYLGLFEAAVVFLVLQRKVPLGFFDFEVLQLQKSNFFFKTIDSDLVALSHGVRLFVTLCKAVVERRKLVEYQVAVVDSQVVGTAFAECIVGSVVLLYHIKELALLLLQSEAR